MTSEYLRIGLLFANLVLNLLALYYIWRSHRNLMNQNDVIESLRK